MAWDGTNWIATDGRGRTILVTPDEAEAKEAADGCLSSRPDTKMRTEQGRLDLDDAKQAGEDEASKAVRRMVDAANAEGEERAKAGAPREMNEEMKQAASVAVLRGQPQAVDMSSFNAPAFYFHCMKTHAGDYGKMRFTGRPAKGRAKIVMGYFSCLATDAERAFMADSKSELGARMKMSKTPNDLVVHRLRAKFKAFGLADPPTKPFPKPLRITRGRIAPMKMGTIQNLMLKFGQCHRLADPALCARFRKLAVYVVDGGVHLKEFSSAGSGDSAASCSSTSAGPGKRKRDDDDDNGSGQRKWFSRSWFKKRTA